jgi:hypothetical protein
MAVILPGSSEYSQKPGGPLNTRVYALRQAGVSIAPQLEQNGGISPFRMAVSNLSRIEFFFATALAETVEF